MTKIRKGECKRCGDCCYIWDKPKDEGGKRVKCQHLIFENGIAICNIYDSDEFPEGCKTFPIVFDKDFPKCGYYWVISRRKL